MDLKEMILKIWFETSRHAATLLENSKEGNDKIISNTEKKKKNTEMLIREYRSTVLIR